MFEKRSNHGWRFVVCALALAACDEPGADVDPIVDEATDETTEVESRASRVADSGADETSEAGASASVGGTASPAPRECPSAANAGSAACEGRMAGMYGVRMDLDVYWSDDINPSAPAYDPGRGRISTLLLGELRGLCSGEGEGAFTLRVCGLALPPVYVSANGGVVKLAISDAAFDRREMPVLSASVQSSPAPDAGFEIVTPVTTLLGMDLESRAAPWPTFEETATLACGDGKAGVACFPDHDADGRPGVSLHARLDGSPPMAAGSRRGGWHYTPVPTDPGFSLLGTGAITLFAGLRTSTGGSYPVGPDCSGDRGAAVAGDVALRVFDCEMHDGAPCTPNGATIADRNMPVFHVLEAGATPPRAWHRARGSLATTVDERPSEGPHNTVVRLGDLGNDITCADVREVFAAAGANAE